MSESLCWSCCNCNPLLCEWVRANGRGDVPAYVNGHEAKLITFVERAGGLDRKVKRKVKVITACERHRSGRVERVAEG